MCARCLRLVVAGIAVLLATGGAVGERLATANAEVTMPAAQQHAEAVLREATAHSAIRNPQSTIRSPQSGIARLPRPSGMRSIAGGGRFGTRVDVKACPGTLRKTGRSRASASAHGPLHCRSAYRMGEGAGAVATAGTHTANSSGCRNAGSGLASTGAACSTNDGARRGEVRRVFSNSSTRELNAPANHIGTRSASRKVAASRASATLRAAHSALRFASAVRAQSAIRSASASGQSKARSAGTVARRQTNTRGVAARTANSAARHNSNTAAGGSSSAAAHSQAGSKNLVAVERVQYDGEGNDTHLTIQARNVSQRALRSSVLVVNLPERVFYHGIRTAPVNTTVRVGMEGMRQTMKVLLSNTVDPGESFEVSVDTSPVPAEAGADTRVALQDGSQAEGAGVARVAPTQQQAQPATTASSAQPSRP